MKGVSHKYQVNDAVKLDSRVLGAVWNNDRGMWQVRVQHGGADSPESESYDFEVLISAVGILNNWRWPDIKGLHDFKGHLLHSANWDSSW